MIVTILAISVTGQACIFSSGRSGPAGVWKTDNGGDEWNRINLVSLSASRKPAPLLDSVNVRSIALAPDRTDILYASTPSGVFASDSGGQIWHHVLKEVDVHEAVAAESDSEVIYAAGTFENRGVVYKSSNRGRDWERVYISPDDDLAQSIAVHPRDFNRILVGFGSGVLVGSTNGGQSWSLVSTFGSRVVQIRFHPTDNSRIILLTREDGLFFSNDGGTNFRNSGGRLGEDFRDPNSFSSFDFSRERPDIIFLTTNVGLFRSTNGGATWRSVRLPVDPRNASTLGIEVAQAGNLLYVSIDTVIYKSLDSGITFNISKLGTNRLIKVLEAIPSNPEIVYAGLIK